MNLYLTRKELLQLAAACTFSSLIPQTNSAPLVGDNVSPESKSIAPRATLFPLSAIRVNGGRFLINQSADQKYLHELEPDRMLSWMRKNAGLAPKAEPYGGWDTGGSFIVGHYLSAISQMSISTGDAELRKRVDYIVSEMADCQHSEGSGGLFAFKGDQIWFENVANGVIKPSNTTPWYVTHKIMAGVRDAWLLTGCSQARDVLRDLCDWCIRSTQNLSPDQWQTMLGPADYMGEFGGPHEVLADASVIFDNPQYLACAKKFKHNIIFDPLLAGNVAILAGQHANTEIPKFIGYERIYELTGDGSWHTASVNFWNAVAKQYTWPNGGAGQWEHFQAIDDNSIYQDCGPETCVSYNMLKLTRQLWSANPSCSYINYYERALYNSILPSESSTGGFVYYTSQRPGHYRVFSRPYDAFWCCVGTGMENHAQLGQMIYGQSKDRLFVNLYIPSQLTWSDQEMTIEQQTDFPEATKTKIKISGIRSSAFTLSLRCPAWSDKRRFSITINGQPYRCLRTSETYIDIHRAWENGDTIDIELAPTIYAEPVTGANYVAFYYGPVLLAADAGLDSLGEHDFHGGGNNTDITNQLAIISEPLTNFAGLSSETAAALEELHNGHRSGTEFDGYRSFGDKKVVLSPLYEMEFRRYIALWPTVQYYLKQQKRAKQLAAVTVDNVIIGDQVDETKHNLSSSGSTTGFAGYGQYRAWRDASEWFSYDLKIPVGRPSALRCAYWGEDAGRRFIVSVDNIPIATVSLTGGKGATYVEDVYPIPASLAAGKSKVNVKFTADGSRAGGVFDIRSITV